MEIGPRYEMVRSLHKAAAEIRAAEPPAPMTTRIVAVDGAGGSGKSTLAQRLLETLGDAPIVQTDDFASADNPLNWWPRLIDQVLKPLAENKPAHYQRYDWTTKTMAEWHDLQPGGFLIIEGVSSSREAFQPYLTFSIWVETPREERLRRGLERDGEAAREEWDSWMADEDAYIEREHPAERADVVIDGTKELL